MESGTEEQTSGDDGDREPAASVDPAALLALIAQQGERTRRRIEPSLALIAGTWGGAWLAGYLTLFVTGGGLDAGAALLPPAWAFIVFGVLLALALVVTAVHIARQFAGVAGESATVGAMYGWTWVIAFVVASMLFAGVARLGADEQVMAVVSNGVSCLVVGLVYMAGGMMWREWRMFALGAWIAIIAGVASLLGPPWTYLVMALAGGGGFLIAATVDLLVRRRP